MIVVGLWSLGLTLCVAGVALLVQNTTGAPLAAGLVKYWGAIPLLFGVELLVASYKVRQAPQPGRPLRIRLHGAGVAGLTVLIVLAMVANAGLGWGFFPFHLGVDSPAYPHGAGGSLKESFTPPDTVRTISFNAPPGHWTIAGGDVTEVTVEASIKAQAISPEWAARGAEETTVSVTDEGSRLVIVMNIPGHRTSSPPWPEVRPTVTGTISVPRNLAIDVWTSVAGVAVSDLKADVAIRTATGDIDVRGVNGDVTLRSSTGVLSVADTAGDIDLRSSTGAISVTGSPGNLKVDTSTGRVRVTDPRGQLEVRTSTGGCTVHSSFPVGGNWAVRTSTGHIDIAFARDSSVKIEAETGTGSITNNLGLSVTGTTRKSLSGVVGDGIYRMTLNTSTASIHIEGTG